MGATSLPGSLCHSEGDRPNKTDRDHLIADMDQAFLEAGDDFCKLDYKNDDLSDLEIRLDRSKILTSGRKGEPP